MKHFTWLVAALPLIAACGSGEATTATFSSGGLGGGQTASPTTTATGAGASGPSGTSSAGTGGSATGTGGSTSTTMMMTSTTSSSSGSACGPCPTGYACGTANGLPVCRSPNGVPLFSHVFVIMMENTTLATLQAAEKAGGAPNLSMMTKTYATASDYHGVAHPSLPNYIALTSGDTQGIACDGDADPTESACSSSSILCDGQLLFGCSCSNGAMNIADQIEAAGKSWMAFGEDMGSPCNITDSGNYAQRHLPFLYYQDIQGDAPRCKAHVVDYGSFLPDSAPEFTFIAPNLVDDMHNPDPALSPETVNIPNGDKWIGPTVASIMASKSYQQGGLLVVLWDEDDGSGGLLGNTDDPIGIFVMSPYAKSGGYVSKATANHYSLLATIEDGLDLPYLGNAATPGTGVAATMADFFPAN